VSFPRPGISAFMCEKMRKNAKKCKKCEKMRKNAKKCKKMQKMRKNAKKCDVHFFNIS
jgi:hypothetical protein